MYIFKRLWLDFKSHIGRYIYEWLQFVIIIYMLSFEVMSVEQSYQSIYFVKNYSDDMYMYANVMNDWYTMNDKTVEEYIDELESIEGVMGIGYDITLWSAYTLKESEEASVIYINDVLDDITYLGTEGKWLSEAEYDEKYVNVVIGSKIGKLYDIGDELEITNTGSNKKIKCKIVGIMSNNSGIIDWGSSGADKSLKQSYPTGWEIYTNDERILSGINSEEYTYSSANLLIRLDDEYDEEELKKYGNIYSFDYMENVNDEYFSKIVYWTIEEYGILIFVVLFGSFTIGYLILSKGMYAIGVYSLLGQTKAQRVVEHLIMHILIYISATFVAYKLYMMSPGRVTILSEGANQWTMYNTAFVVILGVIIMSIVTLTSVCMIRKCPKEIIRAAKEMEG